MPFQRPHAEALREAIEKLSGQRDLRHQDQRLLAAADDLGDRLEIDFGLARAGDAVEQRDVKAAIRPQAPASHRRAVRCCGEKSGSAKAGSGAGGGSRRRHRLDRQRALVDEAVDHAGADAGFPAPLRTSRAAGRPTAPRSRAAAPASCAAAARRPAARRAAPARGRDSRPCAASCAAPCRAPTACSWRPSRRSCAAPASAAARRAFRRRP